MKKFFFIFAIIFFSFGFTAMADKYLYPETNPNNAQQCRYIVEGTDASGNSYYYYSEWGNWTFGGTFCQLGVKGKDESAYFEVGAISATFEDALFQAILEAVKTGDAYQA
jgi:hypothetical protein